MFSCCVQPAVTESAVMIQADTTALDSDKPASLETAPPPVEEAKQEPEEEAPPPVVEPKEEPKKEEQPPVPPVVPVEEKSGVKIVFETSFDKQTVTIESRPIGLWFDRKVPVKVATVRSEFAGAKAGIKEGWTILSVNDEDVSSLDYTSTMAVLDKYVKKLPETRNSNAVDIVFTDPAGKDLTFSAQWSPLGLEFEKKVPIKVTSARIGAYGTLLGVKPGMTFKSVGTEDLTKCKSYDEALNALKKNLGGLPALSQNAKLTRELSSR
jgi:hypothetical protein